jgi:hypothetical protein
MDNPPSSGYDTGALLAFLVIPATIVTVVGFGAFLLLRKRKATITAEPQI